MRVFETVRGDNGVIDFKFIENDAPTNPLIESFYEKAAVIMGLVKDG